MSLVLKNFVKLLMIHISVTQDYNARGSDIKTCYSHLILFEDSISIL